MILRMIIRLSKNKYFFTGSDRIESDELFLALKAVIKSNGMALEDQEVTKLTKLFWDNASLDSNTQALTLADFKKQFMKNPETVRSLFTR